MTSGIRSGARPDPYAVGAAATAIGLWGIAFVGIRAVSNVLTPGALAFGRLAIGSVVLGVLLWRQGPTRAPRFEGGLAIVSGLVEFAAYNLLINTGEHSVEAGTAAMLVATAPILVATFAGTFLSEGYPPRLIAGCFVAFIGAVVIASAPGSASGTSSTQPFGVLLCLGGASAFALGTVMQKRALRAMSALEVTWLGCAIGALACLPFAPELAAEVPRLSTSSLLWLLFLGLGPTAVAFTAWAFALHRNPAGRLGSTGFLVTPTAVVAAWLLLGEVPAIQALAGGGLCLVGVVVAQSRANASTRPASGPGAGPT